MHIIISTSQHMYISKDRTLNQSIRSSRSTGPDPSIIYQIMYAINPPLPFPHTRRRRNNQVHLLLHKRKIKHDQRQLLYFVRGECSRSRSSRSFPDGFRDRFGLLGSCGDHDFGLQWIASLEEERGFCFQRRKRGCSE